MNPSRRSKKRIHTTRYKSILFYAYTSYIQTREQIKCLLYSNFLIMIWGSTATVNRHRSHRHRSPPATVTGSIGLHRPPSPVLPVSTGHGHGSHQSRPAPVTGPIGLHRPPSPVFTGHRHRSHRSHRPSPIIVTGLISLHWSPSPANISVSLRY